MMSDQISDNHHELLATLKFVPHTAKLTVCGYGGEIVMGSITQEAYQYWVEQEESALSDFVLDETVEDVPDSARFLEPGSWYECDDIVHVSGAEMTSSSRIILEHVDTGHEIWNSQSLDPGDLEELGVDLAPDQEHYASLLPQGSCCFFAQSIEKGTFHTAVFTLTAPFDPKQLRLVYDEIEGLQVLRQVWYRDELLEDHDGSDTWGKGIQFAVLSSV